MEKNSCGTGEEKVKKRRRHNKHTLGEPGDMTVHKNKFGFVEIENPVYYNNNYYHAPPQFLMRKATPEERREMVVNYIIRRNGKPIRLLRETVLNITINKSILSSLYNFISDKYSGEQGIIQKFNNGLLADTPEYLEQFEAEGIKNLRK